MGRLRRRSRPIDDQIPGGLLGPRLGMTPEREPYAGRFSPPSHLSFASKSTQRKAERGEAMADSDPKRGRRSGDGGV
jgi:hypothetical protein